MLYNQFTEKLAKYFLKAKIKGVKLTSETVPFDIQTIARKADKIFNLLKRRSKNPSEAYIILKFLTYYFEHGIGVKMSKIAEENLIKIIKENREEINLEKT